MTAVRGLFAYFVLIALAHLVFIVVDLPQARTVTQIAAVPILAIAMIRTGVRSHLTRWMLFGLGFSWLGDTVPRFLVGNAAFVALVGEFLLAQIAFIVAFAALWRGSVIRSRPVALVGYVAVFAALAVACLPGAGSLAVMVVIYGLTLMTMAVLSTGVNRLAGLGGALFFLSDGLIAVGRFAGSWPVSGAAQDVLVMVTYFAAQLLLVLGVLRREGSDPFVTRQEPAMTSDLPSAQR